MEMEEIQFCKRSRIGNGVGGGGGNNEAAKLAQKKEQHQDEDEDDGEGKPGGRLLLWQQHSSSRICRVSRASGGKDRHSKVLTASGPRDRRIRLSVSTAIQFYDLQDRLGLDQPSKAVEWLIKAAEAAIAELPPLEGAFPDLITKQQQQLNNQKPRQSPLEDAGDEAEHHHHHHFSLSKSACSSTSETSKGSVLSLSRSESRVKARERARERTAKEKEKERDDADIATTGHHQQQHMNPNQSHAHGSFTELLTGEGNQPHSPVTIAQANPAAGFFHKQIRHSPTTSTTDYFGQAGFFGHAQKAHQPPGFSSQPHFTSCSPVGMVPFNMAAAAAAAGAPGDHHEMQQQQQQFSFLPDHLIPIAAVAAGGDYSLNFSISSGLAGFNRGTLQSKSPSPMPHHHLQRFASQVDGSNLPFFFSAAAPGAAASGENMFPADLHLCYGDGYRHSDLKGKGKN